MRWTHGEYLSTSDGAAVVVNSDDGWEAYPHGLERAATGCFPSREEAVAAAETMAAGAHCCGDAEVCPPDPGRTPEQTSVLTEADVEVLERETLFQGFFRIDRFRLRHRLFEGGWTPPFTRELFERGDAVGILLFDPDLDRLVLVEQFRIGALAAGERPWRPEPFSPWVVECVAGVMDHGETPEEVARREAREEAGCVVDEIVPVHRYYSMVGGSSESVFIFCGRTDASQAGGVHGLDHEHEDLRVVAISSEEAFARLDQGRVDNAMTLIALQWFRLHHERLRTAWRRKGAE